MKPKTLETTNTTRIASLDYLRGLLAVSVMVYHYASWSGVELGAATVLGRLGVYAVSTFYILSGLSLGLVYRGRINGRGDVFAFVIKRVFRIFPLYWLTLCLAIALALVHSLTSGQAYAPDGWRLFLNFSLLFGFVEPTAYLTTGAWSIGNEMVFYALFPLILWVAEKSRWAFTVLLSLTIGIGFLFAYVWLDSSIPLADQWSVYINPFNQLLLFVAGIALAYMQPAQTTKGRFIGALMLLTACAVFAALPATGDQIVLVTGAMRLVFFALCVMAVGGIYLSRLSLRGGGMILSFLGEGCYSIYLLHPVVAGVVVGVGRKLGIAAPVGYDLAVPATLLVAWMTYRWLERPMMLVGRRWVDQCITR